MFLRIIKTLPLRGYSIFTESASLAGEMSTTVEVVVANMEPTGCKSVSE